VLARPGGEELGVVGRLAARKAQHGD